VAPLAPERAGTIVSAFSGAHVLVIGDAMLDTFIVGRVTRLSPEAPVPVVAFDHQTQRIGGAANVAHNVAALGGHATLIAVAGQDDNSKTLMRGCREAGIEAGFIATDSDRLTTTKVRIVTERNQQVARIDYERDTDIAGDLVRVLVARVKRLGAGAKALLVSDYLKGAITRTVMDAVLHLARPPKPPGTPDTLPAPSIPLIVDPKIPHLTYYAGATLVTPNHHEAEIATHCRIRTDEEARRAAREFRQRANSESVLITRGEHGMWLSSPEAEGAIPSIAREVSDVTGAGDTVVATLALALAAGATLTEAASLANYAAGVVVGRFGPATLTADELIQAIEN